MRRADFFSLLVPAVIATGMAACASSNSVEQQKDVAYREYTDLGIVQISTPNSSSLGERDVNGMEHKNYRCERISTLDGTSYILTDQQGNAGYVRFDATYPDDYFLMKLEVYKLPGLSLLEASQMPLHCLRLHNNAPQSDQ